MSLEQWSRYGWLQPTEPTIARVQQSLQVVDRDISDAQAAGLSTDGRFQHAYDAALQLCIVALLAAGYDVPKGPGRHKRAIDSLRHTLGDSHASVADHVERCSRLRGNLMYERIGVVDDQDADDLLEAARQLRVDVVHWLKANHAALVPPGV